MDETIMNAKATFSKTAMDFIYKFSRFEYSLKRAGYLNDALPNWERFASKQKVNFEAHYIGNSPLESAIQYLERHPPKKQIYTNGNLSWDDGVVRTNQPILLWLIECVKTIRNNLFHGGKFPIGPITDPSRDENLMGHSIVILDYCLSLDADVKSFFLDE